jgi:phage shock protein PspC (stress-responsive transcriptional regulator)
MIAGVCGGLADYLNVDPTVIRLVFLLLLFAGGGGLFIYLILWVIMPLEPLGGAAPIEVEEKPETQAPVQVEPPKPARARKTSPPKKTE